MTLLAKSGAGAPTLLQHTIDVMDAAEALFGKDEPTRLGGCWLRFFRLPADVWPTFHANLLAACGLHDWGKANDGFQAAMTRSGSQAIRHEHLSALLVAQKPVWDWLGGNTLLDREVILSAVLTHHLKARKDEFKLHGFAAAVNQGKRFHSLHDTAEFQQVVGELVNRVRPGTILDLSGVRTAWVFDGPGANVSQERKPVEQLLNRFQSDLDDASESGDDSRRRLLHAVRAALIAADAVGSGLRRTGQSIPDWVNGTFDGGKVWDGEAVEKNVITPRIAQINAQLKRAKREPFKWNDFQDYCADPERVPSRALLLAPCGSGKTLAAWRWIEKQAERGVGHVLFLYPTRATATEGFRDYVGWAPEADAALMHGTSGFDLEKMFENPPEGETRKGTAYKLSEADQRLFALGYWGRRGFSATVDQFLAFLQYAYGPVCMLPVLADSVIVIDEVHSFDNKMFSALKSFLREFDVPVLCMTATLPTNRKEELVKGCGLKPYEDRPGDLATIATADRYRVLRVDSQAVAEQAVREALAAGKRVLWVVNQVNRAHAVVAKFVKHLPTDPKDGTLHTEEGVPVICYHSRYKLTDRVSRHAATMKALKDEPGPALGVTTQVCEMSLDIDVDLLVTENCPVTALVQRMGRCNRSQKPRALGTAGDVLVYDPGDPAPYLKKHGSDPLAGLEKLLELVDGKDLSQDDLERFMRQVDSPASPGDSLSMFLESGPYALAGEEEFRDSEEFNRPCVLPDDVTKFNGAARDKQPGFAVPVPSGKKKDLAHERNDENPEHKKLPRHLGVARAGHYHAAVGFCDKPLTEWGAE
jgi:CRISPR-associated endonuclease/helicase Cas3